jgi:hypothetical protein
MSKTGNIVGGVEYATRTAAARHYGKDPKLVLERMKKFGWTLSQAVEVDSRPSKEYRKAIIVDGIEYTSMREAADKLGIKQSTMMNRIKAGIRPEDALSASYRDRVAIKGQAKPVIYNKRIYPSARELLNANPELFNDSDMSKVNETIGRKARLAKKNGGTKYYSLDDVSAEFGFPKFQFLDEFEKLKKELLKLPHDTFFDYSNGRN